MKRTTRTSQPAEEMPDSVGHGEAPTATPESPLGVTGSFAAITPPQRGSLGAVSAVAVALVALAATQARLGFGRVGDVAVALLALAVVAAGYGLLVLVGVRLVRRLRSRPVAAIAGLVLGGAAVLRAVLGVWIVQPIALVVLGVVGLWGALAASAWSDRGMALLTHQRGRMLGLALGATVLGYLLIGYSPADVEAGAPARVVPSAPLTSPGPRRVERMQYGSGSDQRRAAYSSGVQLRSTPTDLSPYFPLLTGWRARVHARYWGLTLDRAPLNAEVWIPKGAGPFPVVLMLHRVMANERSELGFGYLASQLASHGIAAIAVDANYLNGPWIDAADGGVSARAALLLQHLRFLGLQNAAPAGPLTGRLDLTRIALIGHSRGGESAAAAAMWASLRRNPEFPEQVFEDAPDIRAVVALAPTDGLYRPAGQSVQLQGVSYLLIRGTRDADAPAEAGNGQFQRTVVESNSTTRKMSIAIVGANHARFNSDGDEQDLPAPVSWLLAREGLLPSAAQRALTSTAVVAFLRSVLHGDTASTVDVAAATNALATRLGTTVTVRSRDSRTQVLAEFDEDVDVTTGSTAGVRLSGAGLSRWREGRSTRSGNSVVYLEWDGRAHVGIAPAFELDVRALTGPARAALTPSGTLTFAVANAGPDASFTVELESTNGVVARHVVAVDDDAEYGRSTTRWRSPLLDQSMVGAAPPTLHTVEVSLGALVNATPGFDVRNVRAIRFRFDQTLTGQLLLDDIGLRPSP